MEHTVHDLIKHISQTLMPRYQDKTLVHQYAWWMLEEITNRTQIELMIHDSLTLTKTQQKKLDDWILAQIKYHEPLAYVIGWVPFMDFKIICKAPTLIPRPETEEWCGELIENLKKNSFQAHQNKQIEILDLCTGSGCIAIALARAFPDAHIIATDIADSALALAQENAVANGVMNIEFIKSDIFKSISDSQAFDLIISNPPYIAPEEWKSLDTSVTNWEDPRALEAPDHGLALVKKIINGAHRYLTLRTNPKMPRLIIEIGYLQGPAVKELMHAAGFEFVEIKKDLAGKDRVVYGF